VYGQGALHLTMPYKRRNAKNRIFLTHFRNHDVFWGGFANMRYELAISFFSRKLVVK
jgi:hypothetical protein